MPPIRAAHFISSFWFEILPVIHLTMVKADLDHPALEKVPFYEAQYIGKIYIRLQTIQQGCFCDTINNSTGICTTDTLGKQPIPAAYCKIFDCTLRTIIINARRLRNATDRINTAFFVTKLK